MKKFILISSVLSLVLSGCNGQSIIEDKNIVVDNIETVELAKANEENEESAIVDTVAKNTITLTEEELEALIDKRVEEIIDQRIDEKLTNLNIQDGKDGLDGKNGQDGIGIAGVAVDTNGDLIVALTNGVVANVGHVKGEKGDRGEKGDQGEAASFDIDAVRGALNISNHHVTSESAVEVVTEAVAEAEAVESASDVAAEQQKLLEEQQKQLAESAATQAAAAQAAAKGTVVNCKDGACIVTPDQVNKIHATWDYAGDAMEMAGHHSISELEAVIGPVTKR